MKNDTTNDALTLPMDPGPFWRALIWRFMFKNYALRDWLRFDDAPRVRRPVRS